MPVINIPAQVISITDTDGSVTPLRVRFKDPASGEIQTYSEVNVIKRSDKQMDVNFLCSVRQYNREIKFYLGYTCHSIFFLNLFRCVPFGQGVIRLVLGKCQSIYLGMEKIVCEKPAESL